MAKRSNFKPAKTAGCKKRQAAIRASYAKCKKKKSSENRRKIKNFHKK